MIRSSKSKANFLRELLAGDRQEVGSEEDHRSMLPRHAVLPPGTQGEKARDLMTPFSVKLDPQAATQEPPDPSHKSRALPALGMYTQLAHLSNKKQKISSALHAAPTRKAGHKPTWEWVLN